MNPMAIGIEVAPTCKPAINRLTTGANYPNRMPAPMAREIQRVRKRSSNASRATLVSAVNNHLYHQRLNIPRLKP